VPNNISHPFQHVVPPAPETALAQCPAAFRPLVERDLDAAWAAIGTATVDDDVQRTGWNNWAAYARQCGVDPWLREQSKVEKQSYLLAFAARVRTGIFGRAVQVGHQSVKKALRHVAQTLVMAGFDDPRRSHGTNELDLPFRHLLASYKTQDPAPKPQVALPASTIEHASAYYQSPSANTRAAADLTTTAFFYLLRVGEYTMPKGTVRTRTVQFRAQDVTFRRADGTIIPRSAPLAQLLQAASATLWLDNQKNGQRGATIYHKACTFIAFCPVKAPARHVASILSFGVAKSTPLSFVQPGVHVQARDITHLVKFAAGATNLGAQGPISHALAPTLSVPRAQCL
jgi:hypothetical protein